MVDPLSPYEPGDRFHIGGSAEHVEVRVLSRASAEDYWDGNWLTCEVRVAAGGFVGRFRAHLRIEELTRFWMELKVLQSALKGTANYQSMEEQLLLVLEGDGRGHIVCKGEARDAAGTGNVLRFQFELDQTHLFGTIATLSELLNRYPVRGVP